MKKGEKVTQSVKKEEKVIHQVQPTEKPPGFIYRLFLLIAATVGTSIVYFASIAMSIYLIHYLLYVREWHLLPYIQNISFTIPAFAPLKNAVLLKVTNFPLLTVFISGAFIWLTKQPVTVVQMLMGYDNNDPRSQQSKFKVGTFGARAHAGHQNALESFPLYAVSILISIILKSNEEILIKASFMFIVARIIFHIAYFLNIGILRTLVWIFSHVLCLYLMFQSCIVIQ